MSYWSFLQEGLLLSLSSTSKSYAFVYCLTPFYMLPTRSIFHAIITKETRKSTHIDIANHLRLSNCIFDPWQHNMYFTLSLYS